MQKLVISGESGLLVTRMDGSVKTQQVELGVALNGSFLKHPPLGAARPALT